MLRLDTTIKNFRGLAGDARPINGVDGASVPVGSTFTADDTGEMWVWDGHAWRETNAALGRKLDALAMLLERSLSEQAATRRGLEILSETELSEE